MGMVYPIHSHNDELHATPFWEAFSLSSHSIEADVFFFEEEFKLGHNFGHFLSQTLQEMYIEPIAKFYLENGYVYQDKSLILLIDSKVQDAIEANYTKYTVEDFYNGLEDVLRSYNNLYPGLFTVHAPHSVSNGAVQVIMSGTRPEPEYLVKRGDWIMALDGRNSDLRKIENDPPSYNPSHVYPLFSDNIARYFFIGPFVERYRKKAHNLGSMFRVWGVSDSVLGWRSQVKWGVDLISTDRVKECTRWLSTLSEDVIQKNQDMDEFETNRKFSLNYSEIAELRL
eukprot:GDKJ01002046.1.p1 GENE.GDKJ01002046.1~~GDKJ01002046.1.p1  ORF type:complete len:284 (-),score=26.59 GDKJ01002046.1:332-1183(-)